MNSHSHQRCLKIRWSNNAIQGEQYIFFYHFICVKSLRDFPPWSIQSLQTRIDFTKRYKIIYSSTESPTSLLLNTPCIELPRSLETISERKISHQVHTSSSIKSRV